MLCNCFVSCEEFRQLKEEIEGLCRDSSGKESFGLTLPQLRQRSAANRGKVQHVLAALGEKVKRTVHGTYFYVPNLKLVPKKVRARLFYS